MNIHINQHVNRSVLLLSKLYFSAEYFVLHFLDGIRKFKFFILIFCIEIFSHAVFNTTVRHILCSYLSRQNVVCLLRTMRLFLYVLNK